MKKRPAPTVYKALRRRIVLPMVALWLVLITLITCISARGFYTDLRSNAADYLSIPFAGFEKTPTKAKLSLVKNAYTLISIDRFNPLMLPQRPRSIGSDDWYWGKWELIYGYRYDMCWYDQQGNMEFAPGYYLYSTDTPSFYIDLRDSEELMQWARNTLEFDFLGSTWWIEGLKLTGHLDGNRYYVNSLEQATRDLYGNLTNRYEPLVQVADPVQRGTKLDVTDVSLNTSHTDTLGPFRHRGITYQSAGELLGVGRMDDYGLFSAVMVMGRSNVMGGSVKMAIHCRPIVYVGIRLMPFYLVSGLLLWIALSIILWNIRRKLTEPLDLIIGAYAADRVSLNYNWNPWAELQALGRHFDRTQPERHQAKTEVQRLTTALEYAENAEKHRRQMVSSIAHELKTPLAIIHSYAEGLQSGISAEKRDRYLTVILEETERMDGLVMEMLDLSRLEAGKVKLSTDTVVPAALIRDVFSRLEPAAAEKELQIELNLGKDFTITADEARLEQVIRNFAHNAIRYTPQGGHVHVLLEQAPLGAVFTFRNDSPPLSEEALERVFDSFYRADDQPGGTGLGLAISKSIVTLHGGTCSVSNTPIGVQFRFYIPY